MALAPYLTAPKSPVDIQCIAAVAEMTTENMRENIANSTHTCAGCLTVGQPCHTRGPRGCTRCMLIGQRCSIYKEYISLYIATATERPVDRSLEWLEEEYWPRRLDNASLFETLKPSPIYHFQEHANLLLPASSPLKPELDSCVNALQEERLGATIKIGVIQQELERSQITLKVVEKLCQEMFEAMEACDDSRIATKKTLIQGAFTASRINPISALSVTPQS